ncbi:hypothetical protein pb186bvf_016311, partial [Paramecium bursaria]
MELLSIKTFQKISINIKGQHYDRLQQYINNISLGMVSH